MRLPPSLAALTVLGAGLAACGDGGSGACSAPVREAIDSNFAVHVLGDTDAEYTTDPPTSGPHQPNDTSGVVEEPLTRPVQVGILEKGHVLVQYRPSLAATDIEALEALAGDEVAVAPNPDLPEEVVATAWLFKQSCSDADVGELEEFVADRVGHGPE